MVSKLLIKKMDKIFIGSEKSFIDVLIENEWPKQTEYKIAEILYELCTVPDVVLAAVPAILRMASTAGMMKMKQKCEILSEKVIFFMASRN